jgi:hypothetical protein
VPARGSRGAGALAGMPCEPAQLAGERPVCEFGGGTCRAVVPDAFPIFAGEYSDFSAPWYSKVRADPTPPHPESGGARLGCAPRIDPTPRPGCAALLLPANRLPAG